MLKLNTKIIFSLLFAGGGLPIHGPRALGSQRGQRPHQGGHLLAGDDPLRVCVTARATQEQYGGSILGGIPGMHACAI